MRRDAPRAQCLPWPRSCAACPSPWESACDPCPSFESCPSSWESACAPCPSLCPRPGGRGGSASLSGPGGVCCRCPGGGPCGGPWWPCPGGAGCGGGGGPGCGGAACGGTACGGAACGCGGPGCGWWGCDGGPAGSMSGPARCACSCPRASPGGVGFTRPSAPASDAGGSAAVCGGGGTAGVGVPVGAGLLPDGLWAGFAPAAVDGCWEAAPAAVDDAVGAAPVELPVVGGAAVGGVACVVAATGRRWWAWPPAAGDETTTFSGGGEVERDPIVGRCAVPESSSSAIAAAPMSSGISRAAARRAAAPTASHFSRSLADTASFLPFPDGPPRPSSTNTRNPIGRQPGYGPDVRCFRRNH